MRPANTDWTAELEGRLRALWDREVDGKKVTTSAIGLELGMSKNAIVGKAHRLDLPSRPSPIRPRNLPTGKRLPGTGPTLPPFASRAPVSLRAGRPTTQPPETRLKAELRAHAGVLARRETAVVSDAPKTGVVCEMTKRCCWPLFGNVDPDGLPLIPAYQRDVRPGPRPAFCDAPIEPPASGDAGDAFLRLHRDYCPLHLLAARAGGPALIRKSREDMEQRTDGMRLPGLRCAGCGSEDVETVAPGDEAEMFGTMTVRRAVPDRAWCAACARLDRHDARQEEAR